MKHIEDLKTIIDPPFDELPFLKPQKNKENIKKLENLIKEELPQEIKELYSFYDGEADEIQGGSFYDHTIMDLSSIIHTIKVFHEFRKPRNPKVKEPGKSDKILENITNRMIAEAEKQYKNFSKIEFSFSKSSFGGPYIYFKKNDARDILETGYEFTKTIMDLAKELYELEKEDYNWNKIKGVVLKNGSSSYKRQFFNFEKDFSSYPEKTIKIKYCHYKWVPVISDGGGNYIGIDLDPDINGTKGQVIIFGRDEENMYCLADSWPEFLCLMLEIIESQPQVFYEDTHLHDILKSFVAEKNQLKGEG